MRNGIADLVDSTIGNAGLLRLWIGGVGATQAAQVTCGSPVFGAASGGAMALQGVPLSDLAADNPGTINAFSFHTSGGTEVFRGTCTATGGGGDMTIDNPAVVAGQQINITGFTYNACP
jgi:hypothetical protein